MLARNSKVRLLESIPFFSGCSKDELERLSAVLKEIDVDPGVDVVREGDDSRQFYVIVSGTAECFGKTDELTLPAAGDQSAGKR
jgi:CRP-like cAMP-binding protein